jgi:LmbE family N-acetylglucosaminyl deacetylase
VLVIAAHPDDEVLGCGGSMARHAAMGDRVSIAFLADGVTARATTAARPSMQSEIEARQDAARKAAGILGVAPPLFLNFPDQRLDGIELLDLVQAVEGVVADMQPNVVYTHHGGDLNLDHALVHRVVMTACRPLPGSAVNAIYAFETPSATEWSSSAIGEAFRPTRYSDISGEIERKLDALVCYGKEIPAYPHPRSTDAVKALAMTRGSASGLRMAEAFQVVREVW